MRKLMTKANHVFGYWSSSNRVQLLNNVSWALELSKPGLESLLFSYQL